MYDAMFARTFIATLSVFLIAYQFSSYFSSCTEGGLLGFCNEGGGGGGGGGGSLHSRTYRYSREVHHTVCMYSFIYLYLGTVSYSGGYEQKHYSFQYLLELS
jgi:hypothetical protein